MGLSQAIKGFIVVIAVFFGITSNAFAHAGHAHGQILAGRVASTTGPAVLMIRADVSSTASSKRSSIQLHLRDFDLLAQPEPAHTKGTICQLGACCCQTSSSCGMGAHCCASMMPDQANWTSDLSNHVRYHMARLGWAYPDIVNCLDRPPKA